MKKILTLVLSFAALTLTAQSNNTLSPQEKKDGWKLLFDGKTTKGWHVYLNKTDGSGWQAKDGELFLDPKTPGGGDLMSDKEYENFELTLEWKLEPGGNSGVIFNSIESPKYKDAWNTGPEMQVLDNERHADGKIPKHRAGNLYDLIASREESVKEPPAWNKVKIISNKGHLELWLNDVLQVETTMFTPEWEAMIKGSKFANHPDFGTFRKGHLMLQDHGNWVWYRNIKIKEL